MKTLADFGELKKAEQELLGCCQSGDIAVIGENRPTEKTAENEIRAAFLRWLILTKEVNIDPSGIQFNGAYVSGIINLENCHCSSVLTFCHSIFEETLCLRNATTKAIYIDNSLFKQKIEADGLICQGNLHLRNGFSAEDDVSFIGAKIEGNFDCQKGSLKTLSCDGIVVHGNVVLCDGFIAEGEVRFLNAKVESGFDCSNATFKALNNEEDALNCDGMDIGGSIFLRENCKILSGIVHFSNMTVNSLVDDENFWKQETLKKVYMDGFKYRHIHGSPSASFRLNNMLSKMPEFKPQPYKQLAKVLRDMGHDRDADEVMIALRDKQLEESRESWLYIVFRYIFKWTSAYGYRPMRILKIMASIWLIFGCIYWYGANIAVFAPSNPLIFQKQDYNCTIDKNGTKWLAFPKDYNATNNWYEASPPEYTTFQPFWYSLDIILPVVDLKMEKDWGVVISSPDGSFFTTFNYFIRFLTWSENIIGWILSLLLVAILSGLAKNEKE